MIRLLHTSDLHFGAEDKGALDWFAASAHEMRPDAIVVTGDITQRARRREFAAASRYLSALPAPVILEPGNHDLPYFNPIERFLRPHRRVRKVEGLVEADVELPGVTIVSLPTTAAFQLRFNWSLGHVTSSEIKSAVRGVRAAPPDQIVIVACHHPLVDNAKTGTKGRTRKGETALRKLAAAGADVILSGHVHTPYDLTETIDGNTIRLVGAGTLSERLREAPPGFNEIRIADGEITVVPHVED